MRGCRDMGLFQAGCFGAGGFGLGGSSFFGGFSCLSLDFEPTLHLLCLRMHACVCVYVCARVRACACVRACVQALQVCMPALVCKCRHVCAFVPCGAQDILAGTLLVLLRDPLCVHGMWCLQHSKGYVFVFFRRRPRTNLSRDRSAGMS